MVVRSTSAFSLAVCAGLAAAQVSTVAFTTADDDPLGQGFRNMDAAVAANERGVMTVSNMRFSLFNRSGSLVQSFHVNDAGFPFKRWDTTTPGRFFDPRTDFDPTNDKLWFIMSEDNSTPSKIGGDQAIMHVAVSRVENPALCFPQVCPLTGLNDSNWWFYTGRDSTSTAGNGGQAFDFESTAFKRYKNESSLHTPFPSLADLPTMSIDERAVYLTPVGVSTAAPFTQSQAIVIIPLTHGPMGSLSILNGDRPSESDMTMIRLTDAPLEFDPDFRTIAVQEPFEQEANAQFFITAPNVSLGSQAVTGIQIGGLWYDAQQAAGEEWTYEQRIVGGVLEPMPLPATNYFQFSSGSAVPDTPFIQFSPTTQAAFISSAVMAKDTNGDFRIFAAHHVFPVVQGTSTRTGEVRVQWYVIDPDLTKFRGGAWNPTIQVTGQFGGPADSYHPTIGVTRQGVAYIQYTQSSTTTDPEIRRVQLNNSYTAVIPNSDTLMAAGPQAWYNGMGWADYSDMQADPIDCSFWSSHTLVGPQTAVGEVNTRDYWLFEHLFGCNNANLNGDSMVDLLDMAAFNDFYATGARRVDMNVDGETDATDAILYQDAYDAATSP